MGLTSAAKRGHHKNIRLEKNPEKGKTSKSYLREEVRYDDKNNFGEILSQYHLSAKDKAFIINYLKNRKKKK